MSAALGASLRRAGLIARASAKDLFAGQGVALAILALIGFAVSGGGVRSMGESERHAIELRQRVELLAALSAAAAVLASAHAVGEARRTRSFARFATTPLTAFESLAGKLVGVFAGVAALALPAELLLLLLPAGGMAHRREQFAPRERIAPAQVELQQPDGSRSRWREGAMAALLEAGTTLTLRFDLAPPAPHELELPFALASGEPADAPLLWTLSVQGNKEIRTSGVVSGRMSVTLADALVAPIVVTVSALSGDGVLRIEPGSCWLVGPPESIAKSVVRALAGLLVLLLLASALSAALAVALPDVLACAGAGCVLLLGALRSLFLDVADSLSDPHAHVAESTRVVAHALARLLAGLPDVARAVAAEPLSLGAQPWRADDVRALVVMVAFAVAAWLLGAAWLRRTAGGGR